MRGRKWLLLPELWLFQVEETVVVAEVEEGTLVATSASGSFFNRASMLMKLDFLSLLAGIDDEEEMVEVAMGVLFSRDNIFDENDEMVVGDAVRGAWSFSAVVAVVIDGDIAMLNKGDVVTQSVLLCIDDNNDTGVDDNTAVAVTVFFVVNKETGDTKDDIANESVDVMMLTALSSGVVTGKTEGVLCIIGDDICGFDATGVEGMTKWVAGKAPGGFAGKAETDADDKMVLAVDDKVCASLEVNATGDASVVTEFLPDKHSLTSDLLSACGIFNKSLSLLKIGS